jgi:transcriptional regulator with XRE-family HTH domain
MQIQPQDINRNAIHRAVGVNQSHISKIFNPDPKYARIWPSLGLAKKIAEELGVTMEELYVYLESIGKVNPRDRAHNPG